MEIFSYHVYSTKNGGIWLADDESSWTEQFDESASFGNYEIARGIAAREASKGEAGTAHQVLAFVVG